MRKAIRILAGSVAILLVAVMMVAAAPGTLLDTVGLPAGGSCSVGGTFDGTYYMSMKTDGCAGTLLGIYTPPAPVAPPGLPADDATLVSTKNVVDGGGTPVTISALAWDPSRGRVWGAYDDNIYLIDIGDPMVSGNATATWQFKCNVGGIYLVDGLAYDAAADTVWYSPDVDLNVYEFTPAGALLNTVAPKNDLGVEDGSVSGVVVGAPLGDGTRTLYIGRDGAAEIRRIEALTGDFISQFATTGGRVEDLTCDPVTYAPLEAILAKDAYLGLYEAFEVEVGTCPLPVGIKKTLLEGPDPIDEIGIYLPDPTQFVFEIAYSGPAAKVIDTVPAEFEIVDLVASDGNAIDFGTSQGRGKSATRIEWDAPAGSNTLEVTIQTVKSPGKGHKLTVFKPTSCGPLPLNDGATAYEVDPDTGEIVKECDPLDPLVCWDKIIAGPSNSLVVEAIAGAKPCSEG